MSLPIVECVPNFSEGSDASKIKHITNAIEAVAGARLLDVDPGRDTNRTVVTFVGSPEAAVEAAFRAIAAAAEVIDMSTHRGAHPRMGATDVCPFVPVEGLELKDCAELAWRLGERVGRELEIPVYFYEAAAKSPERKNLAAIRDGEYEGLARKLADPRWRPDCGPARFNPRAGATVIGAREFLIAYNVTLNTRDKAAATDIAFELREKGRVAREKTPSPYYGRGELLFYREGHFPCGNCDFVAADFAALERHCREAHGYDLRELARENGEDFSDAAKVVGKKVRRAGKFRFCKAIGWYVEQYKRAQISINLTNYRITPPHLVLEEARRLAAERGLVVTGSEVVGMIPYRAMLEAGRFYLEKQGASAGVPNADLLEAAVFSLGLNDVQPFSLEKKVIGLPMQQENALVGMKVAEFIDEVSRDTPAPGGGSIAALAGSLGAALGAMVANITHRKTNDAETQKLLSDAAVEAQQVKDKLLRAVDDDTAAFNAYLEAMRLPSATEEQKHHRTERMQAGLKQAVAVPLDTAAASLEAMRLARRMVERGLAASLTDAAVGCQIAFAGLRGGVWNVLTNLPSITDRQYVEQMRLKCDELLSSGESLLRETTEMIDAKLAARLK
jgi:glutamate formiminotransferase/formiminotetrahydrofolate cyclodeaminase